MTWTTNKPTQPGWYWWRRYKKTKAYKVEVRKRRGVLRGDQWLEVWWNGEIVARFDSPVPGPVPGDWAGPIPEPTERDEREI